jgi:hypothetical protein
VNDRSIAEACPNWSHPVHLTELAIRVPPARPLPVGDDLKLGAELVGVSVMQVLEDGQRLPPGLFRTALIPGGGALAQMGQDAGLVRAISDVRCDV